MVDKNPYKGCSWSSYTTKDNCDYVIDLVTQFKSLAFPVGIYTSADEWNFIVGN